MSGASSLADRPADDRIRALLDSAMAAHRSGDNDGAEAGYRAVLALAPDHPEALHLLGVCRHQARDDRDAYALVSRAVAVNPEAPEYQNSLGTILRRVCEVELAMQAFTRALRLRPGYRDARNNLALALCDLKRFGDAEIVLRDSLAEHPDDPVLLTALGRLHLLTDDTRRALARFGDALKVAPHHVDALNNTGVALNLLGMVDEAKTAFERALSLNPSHVDAHYNYAQLLLLLGDYHAAWPHLEWRLKRPDYRRRFDVPMWQGEPLDGRTVLVWCEQGLGDAIHFIRYAPMIRSRGGRVVVECAPPLIRLFERAPGVAAVFERRQATDYDLHVPIMSLPGFFETSLETIPAGIPYLPAPPASRIEAPGARLKVGLVWAGNPDNARDRVRSRRLEEFAPLAALEDVAFFSLQVGAGADDPPPPGLAITNLMPTVKDFHDTAADMAGLDLVISVDSSSAHLAGAIGVPVWVLLDSVADWRWLRDGDRTAWYPAMCLFRSSRGWPALFEELAGALRDFDPA